MDFVVTVEITLENYQNEVQFRESRSAEQNKVIEFTKTCTECTRKFVSNHIPNIFKKFYFENTVI